MPEIQPQRLGRSRLSCREFLEGHSEYLDDLLHPEQVSGFDQHVAACRSCERYDRVVRRGLLLTRNLADVQPSAHFHEKLQTRLMGLEDEPARRPVVASSATVAVIAAMLGLIALTPLLKVLDASGAPAAASAPAAVISPAPVPESWPAPPRATAVVGSIEFSSFTPLVVQAPVRQGQPTAPRLVAYPMVQPGTR
jgi:hypothetical protein